MEDTKVSDLFLSDYKQLIERTKIRTIFIFMSKIKLLFSIVNQLHSNTSETSNFL